MQNTINPLEATINTLIKEIEAGLLDGKINTTSPETALDYIVKLGAYTSTAMGLIEKLDTLEAEHFINNRADKKSDLSVKKDWKVTKEGIRQGFWENRIKRMRYLVETLEKVYYHGRNEQKQTYTNENRR